MTRYNIKSIIDYDKNKFCGDKWLGRAIVVNPYQLRELTEKSFGKFIRDMRNYKGVSLRSLALQIGISAAYLSDIEHSNRLPPQNKNLLRKISDVLEMDDEQHEYLIFLSKISRFEDIEIYLKKVPVAQYALRIAEKKELNSMNKEWEIFVSRIELLKNE